MPHLFYCFCRLVITTWNRWRNTFVCVREVRLQQPLKSVFSPLHESQYHAVQLPSHCKGCLLENSGSRRHLLRICFNGKLVVVTGRMELFLSGCGSLESREEFCKYALQTSLNTCRLLALLNKVLCMYKKTNMVLLFIMNMTPVDWTLSSGVG